MLGLSTSMDTVGPLTHDVADAAAFFAVLDGRFGAGNRPAPDLAGAALDRDRFALPTTLVWEALAPGVEAAARGAVERMRAAGGAIGETFRCPSSTRPRRWSAASAPITPPNATRSGTT